MRTLLLRLSELDADAENIVRVVTFFDGLIAGRAPLPAALCSTARLAECPVGVADTELGVCLRSDGDAVVTADAVPDSASTRELSPGSLVWLERTGSQLPLDEILLERFAIAVAPLLDPARGPLTGLGDTALLELALSESAGQAERARALRLLGYEPATPLHTLALTGEPQAIKRLLTALRESGAHVRAACLGPVHAALSPALPAAVTDRLPPGLAIGAGPALSAAEAPASWRQARTALRFVRTGRSWPAVVHADQLGALAALARLRAKDIAEVADLAVLDGIAAEPQGEELLSILIAFCATGSTRKAATEVHRHHSTVAARLAHAETRLGFPLTVPIGRIRLELALLLHHLRDTAE
ncbi:helix-turn-helix domain-containing protein [Streptomyces sp. NPDC050535]|uniref:helix-turn-helix domain-containing protein n=1 Tax=Streptomyces sp. NPDC050535 TaxID=3365626 RepID=UPI00379A9299